ncbi:hypothetical protein NT04LM_2449 [Listeria monocytogenes FSL F2-208]|nr:hypothetical protein NT04LM_2449 [Listeria monocytogenes FSL F2-208]
MLLTLLQCYHFLLVFILHKKITKVKKIKLLYTKKITKR